MSRHGFYVIAKRINGSAALLIYSLPLLSVKLTHRMYFPTPASPSASSTNKTLCPGLSTLNRRIEITLRRMPLNLVWDRAVCFNWHSLITDEDVLTKIMWSCLQRCMTEKRERERMGFQPHWEPDAPVKTRTGAPDIDSLCYTLRMKLNYTTPAVHFHKPQNKRSREPHGKSAIC